MIGGCPQSISQRSQHWILVAAKHRKIGDTKRHSQMPQWSILHSQGLSNAWHFLFLGAAYPSSYHRRTFRNHHRTAWRASKGKPCEYSVCISLVLPASLLILQFRDFSPVIQDQTGGSELVFDRAGIRLLALVNLAASECSLTREKKRENREI